MDFWLEFLPIIVYILLIIILIVGIVLGVRFIVILGKANRIADNVEEKVRSLDGLFHIIDTATDKVVFVTDKVVDFIIDFISKLFSKQEEETIVIEKKTKRKKEKKDE